MIFKEAHRILQNNIKDFKIARKKVAVRWVFTRFGI